MFDNGNFRRKRKRKSDSLPEEEVKGYTETDSTASSPKEQSNTSQESERGPSPVSTVAAPCLNGFLSQMNEMVSCSSSMREGALLPTMPLGVSLDPQRVSPTRGFSSYSPSATVPQWETQIPPAPQVSISSSPSHYTGSYSDSILSQFSSNVYPGLDSAGMVYPREGTDV